MEEKSREQEMSAREISLIRELAQIRKEYIPSPDLPEQLENVQQSGNEIAERGMQT